MTGHKESKPEKYHQVPWSSMDVVARKYGAGADKYGDPYQWRKGYAWSESFDALMRHAAQFWEGADDDDEDGIDHMASVAFHALSLIYFRSEYPELDDRPNTVKK